MHRSRPIIDCLLNCQRVDGAELIQGLLQDCPTLRLLVTARERLHLSSESVFTLDGMDIPSGTALQETLTYSAVQLFVTTARRTRPKFALDHANAQEIVHICRRTCYHVFQQTAAQHFPYLPFSTSLELMGLCLAACGLDDLPDTGQRLQRILQISLTNRWPANAAKALTFAAILLAKSGKLQRATELLSLVSHHSLSPKGWLAQWPRIARLRIELAATLTPKDFAAAWSQGMHLDLMTTAEAVMTELAGDSLVLPEFVR